MLPAVLPALLPLTLAPRGFCRSADVLQLGEQVTPRQVVNVLGRWRTHGDWDSVGTAKKLDDFVSGDFYEEDAPTFATDLTRVDGPARTPTRREFCLRQGLVQRWVHAESVGLLPFESEELAASVGASAAELDAEPIDPLAAQVVFDALSGSQSGMAPKDACDARRASWEDERGRFAADKFAADLDAARIAVVGAYALFPGFFVAVAAVAAWQVDAPRLLSDAVATGSVHLGEASAKEGPAIFLLPALMVLAVSRGVQVEGGGIEAANIRAQDARFLEEMRQRKRGGRF